jgi:hypothetical protein
MHPERGPSRSAPPYARFRCLVCKEFVVGTATGHCARCGFVPPTAPRVPALASTRFGLLAIALVVVGTIAIVRLLGA